MTKRQFIPITRDLPTTAPATPVTVEAIEALLDATRENDTTGLVVASLFSEQLAEHLRHADRGILARALALLATDGELAPHVATWLAHEHEILCACCRAKAASKAVAS